MVSFRRLRLFHFYKRRFVVNFLQSLFAFIIAATPMTASCQRAADPQRGMQELRALLDGSGGKPSAEDLSKLESRYGKTRPAALARFLRGYLAYSSQNYQVAIDAFDMNLIGAQSSLGDYAGFLRAESEAAMGAKKEAARDYVNVTSRFPDSMKAHEAKLKAAEMHLALNDPNSAMKELVRMVEAKDADAMYLTGQALEAQGQNDKAVVLYRQIYYESPATTARPKAEERLAALGASPKESLASLDEERARADRLFEAKQYWDAAQAYDKLVAAYPNAEQIDEVNLRRGISFVESKQPAQAVLPLTKVSTRNPELYAEALYQQARALRSSNRASDSAVLTDKLISQFPRNPRAALSLNELSNYLSKAGRTAEAAARNRQMVTVFPRSEYAAEASYEIGFAAYQAKDYTNAARIFEQHLSSYRYPDSKYIGECAFFGGKTEEKLGNRARALALYEAVNERYPYGYHGIMAGRHAAALRNADRSLRAEATAETDKMRRNIIYYEPAKETANDSVNIHVTKADDFGAIWLEDLAAKEVNEALEQFPTSPRLNLRLAQSFANRGEYFQATLILRKGYPDIFSYKDEEVPKEGWEIMFPLFHWDTIKQEAKRYGIDPYLAAALIRQESVFNPTAVSRVGARGLMQLMPATGQLISRQQGGGSVTANDLFNPDLNIKLGMNYLAQMIGQLGKFEYAAAGYNAGPNRAKRWVAERGALDMEDWIETIPFSETRGYVQSVLRYAANYRRFYKQ
jgi:soluble lytic murein transglycosylase